MTFKQSPVVFDEDSHSYHLGDKKLIGITGLIHSILGLGVYPDADDYVKDFVIPRAGSRGTAVHHAIQTYDELGVKQTIQIVKTRQGERYEMMEWDVSQELESYIFNQSGGFKPIANELTVSDEEKYASQIDNVWMSETTGEIWLVDSKTNNLNLYPTCGYYQDGYFRNSEEALKEYLSWQLSIYAELFERENPGMKVTGLACNWLRKDESAFWIIDRKPAKLVWELLSTDYIFTDNGAVYFHHNPSIFGVKALPTKQHTLPILSEEVIEYGAQLLKESAEIKARLEDFNGGLRKAMEQYGVKTWDSGLFKATLAADSERKTFDTAAFKKDHPDLYERYMKTSTTKGRFTIKLKDT